MMLNTLSDQSRHFPQVPGVVLFMGLGNRSWADSQFFLEASSLYSPNQCSGGKMVVWDPQGVVG